MYKPRATVTLSRYATKIIFSEVHPCNHSETPFNGDYFSLRFSEWFMLIVAVDTDASKVQQKFANEPHVVHDTLPELRRSEHQIAPHLQPTFLEWFKMQPPWLKMMAK
jgi:hypothetical protein